jgi:hypothetical protein
VAEGDAEVGGGAGSAPPEPDSGPPDPVG